MHLLRAVAAALLIALFLTGTGPSHATVLVTDVPTAAWRVDGVTRAVVVVGDTTYVGGAFSRVLGPSGNVDRANLAAFDTRTGALREEFRADTNGSVRALASDGSSLWVGGSYTTIGGQQRSRLAAVDGTTGALRTQFRADADSHVYGLDLRAGRLFVSGAFRTLGGVERNLTAAVDPDQGDVDPQWVPAPDNTVLAVRADPTGDVVYLAGDFTSVGGQSRPGVTAVSGVTGAPVGPVFETTYAPTLDLDMDETGSRLFAAVGGGGNQVAAWDTTTGRKLWRQRADGDVQAVAHHRGTVYFGFHESFDDDLSLRLLAVDAANGTIDPDFDPSFDRYWGIHAVAVTDDVVAAAGDFTTVGGVPARGIVLFPSVRPPPPPPPPVAPYLDGSSPWRYHDAGSDPGPEWRAGSFDDSAFPVGLPELGYGDGDETTVVSFGPSATQKFIATYFRTTFQVDTPPQALTLSLVADDGAVVHLNGTEVVRDNMPTGPITNETRAMTNRSGSAEVVVRSFTVDPALVLPGTNTITASVHQDYPSSSDLSFNLGLHGELPPVVSTTTTTSTTTAPAHVLARWSSGVDSFDLTTGTPPTVTDGGSHGERLSWAPQPDAAAFVAWTSERLGAPGEDNALRWVTSFSALPPTAFTVAQGLDDAAPLTQRWRLELTPDGRVRIRNGDDVVSAESTGQGLPVGAEVRLEAVRSGTDMTVQAFSPPSSEDPLLSITGTVDAGVNHIRLGQILAEPTPTPFTVDEVVLTDGDLLVGAPK